MPPFKECCPFEQRQWIALDGLGQGKVPILCERAADATVDDLEKKKFLVAPSMTTSELVTVLGRRLEQQFRQPVELFLADGAPLRATAASMRAVHDAFQDADGLLYVHYARAPLPGLVSVPPLPLRACLSRRRWSAAMHATPRRPSRVRVVCRAAAHADPDAPDLTHHAFVVPYDASVARLAALMRQQLTGPSGRPLAALYVNATAIALPPTSDVLVGDLYMEHKCDDEEALCVSYTWARQEPVPTSTASSSAAATAASASASPTEMATVCAPYERYRDTRSFAERFRESAVVIKQGNIPIICEPAPGSGAPALASSKFLIDPDATVRALVVLLRERITAPLSAGARIYLFVAGYLLTTDAIAISDLHQYYKDEDDHLYVTYTCERPEGPVRHIGQYRSSHSFKERMREANRALSANKIPIICERKEDSRVPRATQRKFFVVEDMAVGTFYVLLRERIMTEVAQPVYLFIDGVPLAVDHARMRDLYAKHKDEDNILYVSYAGEQSFY